LVRDIGYFLLVTEKKQLHDIWSKGDLILIHYPALIFVSTMPAEILEATNICVFYVAPGYPNYDMPWVFSQRMRDPRTKLRTKSNKNLKSTLRIWEQQSILNGSINVILNMMKRSQIVALWDSMLMPWPKTPFSVTKTGAFIDREALKGSFEIDPTVRKFVEHGGQLMYFTLGTFNIPIYPIISGLLSVKNIRIIYHDTNNLSQNFPKFQQLVEQYHNRLIIFTGFIPHEYIVPKCRIIATTGSICLVNIALYYGIPYINIPMLNEQFMWAKNYKERAGVPYIDIPVALSRRNSDSVLATMAHDALIAVRSVKTKEFMAQVKKSVRANDGVKMLIKAIEKQVKAQKKS